MAADEGRRDASGAEEGAWQVSVFQLGPIQTNCYVLHGPAGDAIVVDPAASGAALADALANQGLTVRMVVCTNGHGDHAGGVAALVKATGAPFAISAVDAELARHAGFDLSLGIRYDDDAPEPDRRLAEGDVIEVADARLRVIETPGHTPGSIVLLGEGAAEEVAFVGDTIFAGSVGRCDLPGGDAKALMASLDRLKDAIPPETTLLPGHGPATTMASELRQNPYLAPGASGLLG
jgi:hydroxyacylglutathione hydrolase